MHSNFYKLIQINLQIKQQIQLVKRLTRSSINPEAEKVDYNFYLPKVQIKFTLWMTS